MRNEANGPRCADLRQLLFRKEVRRQDTNGGVVKTKPIPGVEPQGPAEVSNSDARIGQVSDFVRRRPALQLRQVKIGI